MTENEINERHAVDKYSSVKKLLEQAIGLRTEKVREVIAALAAVEGRE